MLPVTLSLPYATDAAGMGARENSAARRVTSLP
jgi:hypothetical protein